MIPLSKVGASVQRGHEGLGISGKGETTMRVSELPAPWAWLPVRGSPSALPACPRSDFSFTQPGCREAGQVFFAANSVASPWAVGGSEWGQEEVTTPSVWGGFCLPVAGTEGLVNADAPV